MRTGRETVIAMTAFFALLAPFASATAHEPVTREESAEAVLHASPIHRVPTHTGPVAHSAGEPASPTLTHRVYGYYPSWTGDDFSEMRFELLSHVAYFTGGCTSAGAYSAGAWPFDELVTAAHADGTKVMLVIPCFGAAKLDAVFANKTAFIDSVVAAFSSGTVDADGIDLDFEGMGASHRADFPAFAEELAAAIRAVKPDAEFAAALPAIDWSNAYDYDALAEVLDHLIIMGYGYHWSGGNPGPVSPLDYAGAPWTGYGYDLGWSVNDYATEIGTGGGSGFSKVLLGLPYYGYDWPSTDFSVPGTKAANATSRTYAAAVALAGSGGGASFDAASQTSYFFYDAAGQPRQLWFDDAQTLAMKYERAKDWNLGGIAIWALQYDRGHDALWTALESAFVPATEPDPTATPTPAIVDPPAPQWREPSNDDPGAAAASCSLTKARASMRDGFPLAVSLLAVAVVIARRRR